MIQKFSQGGLGDEDLSARSRLAHAARQIDRSSEDREFLEVAVPHRTKDHFAAVDADAAFRKGPALPVAFAF